MSQEISAIWTDVLKVLEDELSRPSFDAWLKTSAPVVVADDAVEVPVPHDFARDWLETRYAAMLSETMSAMVGRDVTVRFVAREGSTTEENADAEEQAPEASRGQVRHVESAHQQKGVPSHTSLVHQEASGLSRLPPLRESTLKHPVNIRHLTISLRLRSIPSIRLSLS